MPMFRRLLPVASAAGLTAALCAAVPAPAAAASETPIVVTSGWSAKTGVARVTCPSGTGLVGGGYAVNPTENGFGQVTDFIQGNAPSVSHPNAWAVQSLRGQAKAYAMCVTGAPTPTVVASKWSDPGKVVAATCSGNQKMIGGGYWSQPATNGVGQNMDEITVNAPYEGYPNTWMAGMQSGLALAFAMCVD
ncbi:hypothetical protein [Streptomyces sp. AA1529]|uniref:hypothetical protein n=1 Tax=Streptomyces sp. AA1529 TaxID=1203257 RepID=UPI003D72A2C9